ncbi:MAG: ATP-dependent DNA helicase RecG [Lactobacillus sp.]|uniref:ATP-dependent DNA helicase RecG n=1 Tax=Lacticaseibacillus suilingensis TaxID=2799577 RepID=A0ABW4BHM0_9LACO|nr:ATP-dependent DNA helicase RecG [Lacticaseibacillus suilingensis]MCI1894575.1 ATP-dependent DNA helicase RecG [Lactobacillus sp.]MCI1918259.1 ATP-dependent DNA helicase RecG [Lactobacillus sp.]MCI1940717.1 ATP-dependent DNA helicase RecG [Lactobacillus sp.]MCI1971403.1 ATP-dependent DNA helicase RecG [Lactobacillus sp.]MCI2016510.1 ATP-dependent DNA helicase RecG [Lactobacillus sp.]
MTLHDSVTVLPGVGPKRQQALAELGLRTVGDVLFYFPFRYDDLQVKDLAEAADQEKVTLKGVVVAPAVVTRFGPRKSRVNVRVQVDHAIVLVTFFNQPWLKDKFEQGTEAAIYGKWDAKRHTLLGMKVLATQTEDTPSLAGIYPTNKNIRQSTLVQLVKDAWADAGSEIQNVVPAAVRERFKLMSDQEIVHGMHFPDTPAEAKAARRSAIFREFFLFECQIQALREDSQTVSNGLAIPYDNAALKALIQTLPFELTTAQKRVVNEICLDMKSPHHMNRLLQGDVGSGKTIVAAIVMYAAITARYQAALMVPTEVLAEQHYAKLTKLFADFPVKLALLTGNTTTAARRDITAGLRSGEIDLVIGTHALIQKNVDFANLGLVIIDEQHRFGVNQRKILRDKGLKPDLLAMTATPIPRTLAITAYGEMDVSTIDELPAGRQPITTTWVRKNQLRGAFDRVRQELQAGHQVFAITPLIAESEKIDLQNAEQLYEELSREFDGVAKVALLHGQMKAEEKDDIMRAFSQNEVQVLVSTTVVEVGVDVPNATVMLIFDADRFGLAQLHQLRGRVGRGHAAAYCILVADPKNDTGVARMQVMVETTNGFTIAEKDLELRGSGDIFGAAQSGLPSFKIADPVNDYNTLNAAQQTAVQLFKADPSLSAAEFAPLRAYLAAQQQKVGSLD